MARIVVCSNVAADSVLYLARCVGAGSDGARVIHSLDEGKYRRLARGGMFGRIRLRMAMYLGYPCRLALGVITASRGTCFVVTSNTFFAPALAALLGRLRGVRVVHLLYDLFPDALEVAGVVPRGSLVSRLLGCVARLNLRWPDGVVYLGKRLRSHAEHRWGRARNGAVIDIATDVRLYPVVLPVADPGALRLHYGGQLGAMHDSDSLVAAMRRAAECGLLSGKCEVSFYISGSRAASFERALAGCPVSVRPTLTASEWRHLAAKMHIGLVTLGAGGGTVCLPSKTYAMMASGMAIIAICPLWSDLAELVLENSAGWVIDNAPGSDPAAPSTWADDSSSRTSGVSRQFVALLLHLAANRGEVEERRTNAYRAAHERYGVAAIQCDWAAFLARLDVK